MKRLSVLVLAVLVVIMAYGVGAQSAVTMDWITVGNAGNADDTTGYGGVSYMYQISKYEVTAGQYTEFLNAVAATDTYGLYSFSMWFDSDGCKIQRNGSPGSYTYSVASDRANRPVNYVSWYDSLRFANWLHNGQGTGDTEDGAYDMSLDENVVRKSGALVWLPNEDEWYKAAYHKNDGVTGNYFDYPTSSDSTPSNDLTNPDPGNNATFYDDWYTIGSPYYRTEVGAHENSDSPYGAFDMAGNVWEWNETTINSNRGIRGGSWGYYGGYGDPLSSSVRIAEFPNYAGCDAGFRVAYVIPAPGAFVLGSIGIGFVTWLRRRRTM